MFKSLKVLSSLFLFILFLATPISVSSDSSVNIVLVTSLNDSGSGTLREAITKANYDSSPTLIKFHESLKGGIIELTSELKEWLLESGTTIDGDIDKDGIPDITLENCTGRALVDGIHIGNNYKAISDMTVRGLHILNFRGGIIITEEVHNVTIENNWVEVDKMTFPTPPIGTDVDMRGIEMMGVGQFVSIRKNLVTLPSGDPNYPFGTWQSACHVRPGSRCEKCTNLYSSDIEIIDNVFENGSLGIDPRDSNTITERVLIARNKVSGNAYYGNGAIAIDVGLPEKTPEPFSHILRDVQIMENQIYINRYPGIAIYTHVGTNHQILNLRIIKNKISTSQRGIYIRNKSNNTKIYCEIEENTISDNTYQNILIYDPPTTSNSITFCKVFKNTITNSYIGLYVYSKQLPITHYSNIFGNNFGFYASSISDVDARWNYWGSTNGPSGEGRGKGDAVSENVIFHPHRPQMIDIFSLNPPTEQNEIIIYGNNIQNHSRYGIVYWHPFYPPKDPALLLQSCIDLLSGFDLKEGVKNSLLSKLENALDSLQKKNYKSARNQIEASINEALALRDKELPRDQADCLIDCLQNVLSLIP